jgi:hypothetical protein
MWKSIVGSWLNVRLGLIKADPISSAETFRQPLFDNPSILNTSGAPLGFGGLKDGNAFAKHGCKRIKDLWNPEEKDWKSLSKLRMSYHASNKLRMSYHASNRRCKEAITASIPWRLDECASHPQPREWISIPNPNPASPLDWVYFVLQSGRDTPDIIEYKKSAPGGRIQATTHQVISSPRRTTAR